MTWDRHLDRETYRRLTAGEMPPAEARGWADHLDRDCEPCEQFLAAAEPDALDGLTDAALAEVAPTRAAGNDMEYARIQRALRQGGARPARRLAPLLAIAAVALVAGGVAFQVVRAPKDEWDGVKAPRGAVNVIPASLRFAVAGADLGNVERGATGQVLPPEAGLLFRIEVGAPAFVALLRAGPGDVEVVFQQHAERAGPVDVMVDGRPAVYPLRGLSGAQRFILVAGAHPLTPERLAEAARILNGAAAQRGPAEDGLTLDVVEVTVR